MTAAPKKTLKAPSDDLAVRDVSQRCIIPRPSLHLGGNPTVSLSGKLWDTRKTLLLMTTTRSHRTIKRNQTSPFGATFVRTIPLLQCVAFVLVVYVSESMMQ
jgi:hypothetical protein